MVVTGALEVERAEKRIGSSLQAHPVIYTSRNYFDLMDGMDCAEIVITSDVTLTLDPVPKNAFILDDVKDVGVLSQVAKGKKCARCYKILPEVDTISGHKMVCGRCADALNHYPAAA